MGALCVSKPQNADGIESA